MKKHYYEICFNMQIGNADIFLRNFLIPIWHHWLPHKSLIQRAATSRNVVSYPLVFFCFYHKFYAENQKTFKEHLRCQVSVSKCKSRTVIRDADDCMHCVFSILCGTQTFVWNNISHLRCCELYVTDLSNITRLPSRSNLLKYKLQSPTTTNIYSAKLYDK